MADITNTSTQGSGQSSSQAAGTSGNASSNNQPQQGQPTFSDKTYTQQPAQQGTGVGLGRSG
jgi:hypothetical protein